MEKIPIVYINRFVFVVSMGSTIAHLGMKNLDGGIKRARFNVLEFSAEKLNEY